MAALESTISQRKATKAYPLYISMAKANSLHFVFSLPSFDVTPFATESGTASLWSFRCSVSSLSSSSTFWLAVTGQILFYHATNWLRRPINAMLLFESEEFDQLTLLHIRLLSRHWPRDGIRRSPFYISWCSIVWCGAFITRSTTGGGSMWTRTRSTTPSPRPQLLWHSLDICRTRCCWSLSRCIWRCMSWTPWWAKPISSQSSSSPCCRWSIYIASTRSLRTNGIDCFENGELSTAGTTTSTICGLVPIWPTFLWSSTKRLELIAIQRISTKSALIDWCDNASIWDYIICFAFASAARILLTKKSSAARLFCSARNIWGGILCIAFAIDSCWF